ncbi:MAG: M28 family peptidase [Dehalococcoidia bacterium]|nr:M28 family peptidase [Dehalococcoidia bacterium]
MRHVQALAVDIGSRPAGSAEEREAAEYIAGELRSYGYAVDVEPFSFASRVDDSLISLPDGVAMRPFGLGGSGSGEATGPLVDAGLGGEQALAEAGARGAVVVVQRGELTFEQKARNAQQAGAAALIIVNNEAGPLFGSLGGFQAQIPVVGAIPEDGEVLRDLARGDRAEVTVRAGIGSDQGDSQNVVARAGEECRWYIGGHYDSVPAGPGANDNASGTAVVLELARAHRTDGLCVIAFGAEEIGLFGSRAYVRDHDTNGAEWLLNFDMQGRIDGAKVIGDALLTEEVLIALEGGDFPLVAGSFPRFASSDHVSFADAGVPAVTVTSGDDPFIHSSRDDIDNVHPDDLETMLAAADVMLEAMLTGVTEASP